MFLYVGVDWVASIEPILSLQKILVSFEDECSYLQKCNTYCRTSHIEQRLVTLF